MLVCGGGRRNIRDEEKPFNMDKWPTMCNRTKGNTETRNQNKRRWVVTKGGK